MQPSRYCPKRIARGINAHTLPYDDSLLPHGPPQTPDELQAVIKSGFLLHDSNLRELPEMTNGVDHSGSTAITCMVLPQHYVVGNCGTKKHTRSHPIACL